MSQHLSFWLRSLDDTYQAIHHWSLFLSESRERVNICSSAADERMNPVVPPVSRVAERRKVQLITREVEWCCHQDFSLFWSSAWLVVVFVPHFLITSSLISDSRLVLHPVLSSLLSFSVTRYPDRLIFFYCVTLLNLNIFIARREHNFLLHFFHYTCNRIRESGLVHLRTRFRSESRDRLVARVDQRNTQLLHHLKWTTESNDQDVSWHRCRHPSAAGGMSPFDDGSLTRDNRRRESEKKRKWFDRFADSCLSFFLPFSLNVLPACQIPHKQTHHTNHHWHCLDVLNRLFVSLFPPLLSLICLQHLKSYLLMRESPNRRNAISNWQQGSVNHYWIKIETSKAATMCWRASWLRVKNRWVTGREKKKTLSFFAGREKTIARFLIRTRLLSTDKNQLEPAVRLFPLFISFWYAYLLKMLKWSDRRLPAVACARKLSHLVNDFEILFCFLFIRLSVHLISFKEGKSCTRVDFYYFFFIPCVFCAKVNDARFSGGHHTLWMHIFYPADTCSSWHQYLLSCLSRCFFSRTHIVFCSSPYHLCITRTLFFRCIIRTMIFNLAAKTWWWTRCTHMMPIVLSHPPIGSHPDSGFQSIALWIIQKHTHKKQQQQRWPAPSSFSFPDREVNFWTLKCIWSGQFLISLFLVFKKPFCLIFLFSLLAWYIMFLHLNPLFPCSSSSRLIFIFAWCVSKSVPSISSLLLRFPFLHQHPSSHPD